jgi:RsmE family RNA methyltransferase
VNLLLFTDTDRTADNQISIADSRLQHLREVHKAAVGDSVRVGELNGLVGQGEIVELTDICAVLTVNLQQPPPPKLPLTLIVALPRPKMLRRILRTVAELGVQQLHLINSSRVEKSYWQTPALDKATIEGYLIQGLQQSRDTQLPAVHCHKLFKPFAEDALPGLIDNKRALLVHPGEYPPCPREPTGSMVLIIGPEGGFIPYEVEKFQSAGCTTVSLGPRILRVENAVISVIGRMF